MKIIIINGPNLNLLGKRETNIYGNESFEDYLDVLKEKFPNFQIDYFQSNHEGEIIDKIHYSDENYNAILINAGGYSHTSVAIFDAIKAISCQVIEIHISNIYSREDFRTKSLLSSACKSVICGFGLKSYYLALESLRC
tara:strand:- start:462 stop:878 length:417 start_codon:yes stop_codon:yes gene_type:complete